MTKFVDLAEADEATAFFASELTREHLREVVKFFVSAEPCAYILPFNRLGTGSVNVLVFALLTFIAELKEKQSVIFAMEEPEIALPPHTQRRVAKFVLSEMGQAIVTSHSPYVIEQFEPDQITILSRSGSGELTGTPIDLKGIKPKAFTKERRQFAEAVLAKAVLVLEGHTEAVVFPAASTILESAAGGQGYSHLDQAGISVFNAGSDGSVPKYGRIFKALGKPAFCFYDKPKASFSPDAMQQLATYVGSWQSPEKTIERLLVRETPVPALRRFLEAVKNRLDYPSGVAKVATAIADASIAELAEKVLLARKGDAGAVWNGREQSPKTRNAIRQIDIDCALADLLKQHLAGRTTGRVFQARNGSLISGANILKRVLHPILRRLGIPKAGLHAFRHSRVTMLRKRGTPADLQKLWIGHSSLRTTDRYSHTDQELEYRRLAASKAGLDFVVGPNGPKMGECVGQ
jgi:hypothetical protein